VRCKYPPDKNIIILILLWNGAALESRLPRQRSRWEIALEDAVHHLWADKNPIPFTSWDIHPGFGYRERQI
jgi:hypothetical protein